MRTNSVTLSNPNPRLPFELIQQGAITGERKQGGFVVTSVAAGKDIFQKGFDITVKSSKIIFGFLGLVGGAVAAALFKENTAADWGSKILMIAGAILGVLGVKDLMNFNKGLKQKIKPEKCFTEVSEQVGKPCRDSINSLTRQDNDPHFTKEYNPQNPGQIRLNKASSTLRAVAVDLLRNYTHPELIKHAATYVCGVEYHIKNIDNEPVSLTEFGDRIVMLLGYVHGSGPLDVTVENILKDVENRANLSFNYDLHGTGVAKILPSDFRDAYCAARWYRENHLRNNTSIGNLIGGEVETSTLTTCLASQAITPETNQSGQYLRNLQQAQNYLSALQKIINYVLDPINLTDPQKARNVIILRQALICGFSLKDCQDLELINDKLSKILKGEADSGTTYTGLKAKLEEVTKRMDSPAIQDFFRHENCPFLRKPSSVSGDDVLGGMTWYEIVRKQG